MPRTAAARVARLLDDGADSFQGLEVISVLSERIFDVGLFEHGIDTTQPVRLRVGHHVEASEGIAEIG